MVDLSPPILSEENAPDMAHDLAFQVLNNLALGVQCEADGCSLEFEGWDWIITDSGLLCSSCHDILMAPVWGNA